MPLPTVAYHFDLENITNKISTLIIIIIITIIIIKKVPYNFLMLIMAQLLYE